MTPFVWNERQVRLEEGNLLISRKGDPDGWDFANWTSSDDALAANPGSPVLGLSPLDNNRLLIKAVGGKFVLEIEPILLIREARDGEQ